MIARSRGRASGLKTGLLDYGSEAEVPLGPDFGEILSPHVAF